MQVKHVFLVSLGSPNVSSAVETHNPPVQLCCVWKELSWRRIFHPVVLKAFWFRVHWLKQEKQLIYGCRNRRREDEKSFLLLTLLCRAIWVVIFWMWIWMKRKHLREISSPLRGRVKLCGPLISYTFSRPIAGRPLSAHIPTFLFILSNFESDLGGY